LTLVLAGAAVPAKLEAAQGKKAEATPEVLAEGKTLYQKKCAVCHGTEGKGDGPATYLLYPKPRDLTTGVFKIRSTTTLPTDEDLFRTITKGIEGTSMPSWADLSEKERWSLVAYIKSLSDKFKAEPLQPITIPKPPARTEKLLARGKELYEGAGCYDCHGRSGKGDGPAAATLKDEWGYPIVPYDFTIPGKMKGGSTLKDFYRTLTVGIGGTPMPSYADSLSDEDRWALAYYVFSLAQKPLRERVPKEPKTIVSKFMKGELPLDPSASTWENIPFTRVHLEPLWSLVKGVEEVRVKSLHNGKEIAFLLEWDDPTQDQDVLRSQDFRDAAAIQFSVKAVKLHGAGHPEPLDMMGDEHGLVNIWHWKADWEADLKRYRDLQDRYPGMAADVYLFHRGVPPGSSSADHVMAPASTHDPTYLSGWGVGNLLSTPIRRSSVEDLNAIGFGTLTSQPPEDQNVQGRGIWKDGKWRVVMTRAIRSESDRDAEFTTGHFLPIAFAVWDGSQKDRDGQKAVSVWQHLKLEEAR